jgi:tetratricopeptide (TPR) repeat protein
MATEMAPSWPASQADAAALLSRWGKAERAAEAWELVARAAPRDLRFVLPIAQARLAAGDADEAARALDALPGGAARDPDVISLRVAIADAVLPGGAGDSLLEQWQEIAPEDPLPVRRRIALRIREGDYAEALDFIPELGARGEELAARRLEMGLAVGVGQWERGALAAEAAGDAEMARRIRGRGALEADPASVPEGLEEVTDPAGVLVLARALLAANQARGALLEVRTLLEQNPYNPDALVILAECLERMGDEQGADEARRKLYLADPDISSAWPGPSTAPGSTGAGVQSQAAPEE